MYMKIHIEGNEKSVGEAWKQIMKALRQIEFNEGVDIEAKSSPVDLWSE